MDVSRRPSSVPPPSRRDILRLRGRHRNQDSGYWIRVARTAMACRFEVTLNEEDKRHIPAAQVALAEVDRIEQLLTVFRDTSDVSRLNAAAGSGPVQVDAGLFALLQRCRELHSATEGAFDITTTPLSRAWGFLRRAGRLPEPAEVEEALARTGIDHVVLDPDRRTIAFKRPGLELSFGSVGKGYALDEIAALLRRQNVDQALLSAAGSSVLAIGGGRQGWSVHLRPRRGRREVIGRLWLRDAALATSGAGEQFFEVDGRRFGHVLDPRSGWPAQGVLSASVVAPDAATADALSTAFLVGGPGLAERYCASHPSVLAVVVADDSAETIHRFGSCPGVELEDVE
jgi:FAD:protein FMN transferase